MPLPLRRPTAKYVSSRLDGIKGNPEFYGGERSIELVFRQWPRNTDPDEIRIKIIVLNRIYNTRIFAPYTVAKHVHELDIDQRLRRGDLSLVADVARVRFKKKRMTLLSFAAKYCGWHQPEKFQIFDNNVAWALWQYKKQYDFATFFKYELRNYPKFVGIVDAFIEHFELGDFSRKDIDKFLWAEGR